MCNRLSNIKTLGEKKIVLFAKKRPGELFLPLYLAGGIAPISIFPSLWPYKCFCYKILSCKSDNRIISLLYPSTGYGRNILWEDTEDFSAHTNIRSRWEVAGGCRKFKTGLNNCQKKGFPAYWVTFIFPMRFFANKVFFLDCLSPTEIRLLSNWIFISEKKLSLDIKRVKFIYRILSNCIKIHPESTEKQFH